MTLCAVIGSELYPTLITDCLVRHKHRPHETTINRINQSNFNTGLEFAGHMSKRYVVDPNVFIGFAGTLADIISFSRQIDEFISEGTSRDKLNGIAKLLIDAREDGAEVSAVGFAYNAADTTLVYFGSDDAVWIDTSFFGNCIFVGSGSTEAATLISELDLSLVCQMGDWRRAKYRPRTQDLIIQLIGALNGAKLHFMDSGSVARTWGGYLEPTIFDARANKIRLSPSWLYASPILNDNDGRSFSRWVNYRQTPVISRLCVRLMEMRGNGPEEVHSSANCFALEPLQNIRGREWLTFAGWADHQIDTATLSMITKSKKAMHHTLSPSERRHCDIFTHGGVPFVRIHPAILERLENTQQL